MSRINFIEIPDRKQKTAEGASPFNLGLVKLPVEIGSGVC